MSAEHTAFPSMASLDDGVYHVYAMCFAKARPRRVHDHFIVRDMHDGPMPMDYSLWIVRNQHRTIIVDTGYGERAARERNRPLDFDPIEGLRRIGIDPDAVGDVIITHLHYDHAGNIGRFGKARFHVQDSEVAFATGRCMCEKNLRFPFDVEDVVTLVRHTYADRVCFHDGNAEPLPGISLHKLPGHSQGMQSVRVMTSRGPVLLASDVSHYYANFLRRVPFAVTVDMRESLQSYSDLMKIAGSVDRIVPGHDPKVRRLYPCCTVAGIELTALHEEPRAHDVDELARVDDY
jgi:glyoxylase-like metal-dependent hydrolase (beta-lactamase superfamily II)